MSPRLLSRIPLIHRPDAPRSLGQRKGRGTTSSRTPFESVALGDALTQLRTDPERGLNDEEARSRLNTYGPNTVEERKKNPLLKALSYFWGPIPWMLEAACILSGIDSRWEELFIVLALLLINGGVSWWHESSAAKAVEALKEQLAPRARVMRGGRSLTVDARDLVPGDIAVLRRGDVVPADARLLATELSLDESSLTGESLPVDKGHGDALYAGTAVKRGDARALVVATGDVTRFGRTIALVGGALRSSHFQQAVLRIGYFLMAATSVLVAAVVIAEILRGRPWLDALLFALVLTVAGIPAALPAVLSVTMAIGARRLAAQKAIVTRLAAMEELAGVQVLFSDKTGTLTLNRLTLDKPVLLESRKPEEVNLAAALTADRGPDCDAIDAAILSGVDAQELEHWHVRAFMPFDSTRKRAEAEVVDGNQTFRVAKGAPQVMLDLCSAGPELRARVAHSIDDLAARGLRALGVARKDDGRWRYLGLLSLLDPPRDDSAEVVRRARALGIDVRMVTGDHDAIARHVAQLVGLGQRIALAAEVRSDDAPSVERTLSAEGFAEVTPEDKYRIVERFQRKGRIVGMTGDGVNDAPALKKADAGFAVSGATDAARAAADIVLTRPGLGVIIAAVEEARRIFERMLSYATYRIAETIRMVTFIAGTILVLGIRPATLVMVALLAILNDIPIMTIAADNVATPPKPVRWNMPWVLTDASVLGVLGVIASAAAMWFATASLRLPLPQLQTFVFLKLLVAGHLTIYLVRARGWFWRRPWPSWKLVVALEATQVIGTLVAGFGWLVAPIPWWLVFATWGYAIAWMFINGAVRVLSLRNVRPVLEKRLADRIGA